MLSSMLSILKILLIREYKINLKRKDNFITLGLFFVIVVSLFPLGNSTLISTSYSTSIAGFATAAGIIWVAALLVVILSLDRQFRCDYQLGILEQFAVSEYPLQLLAFGQMCAHYLLICLPLLCLTPFLCFLLQINSSDLGIILATLILGLPALSATGSIVAILTVGLPNGGIMMSLLLLPLYVPTLIFATSAITNFQQELPYLGQLAILAALSVGSVFLAPFAVAQGIRLSVTQ